ncbi:MAG: hypothetical protein M1820_001296 [Bogoriella megaspora]|nr:MAG: hypothetical protein M1820_001296 [Bogoriella megaspora]
MAEEKHDVEAATSPVSEFDSSSTEEVIVAKELQHRFTILHKLRQGEEWLDAKMGIETRGIDRIPDEEKRPPSIWNIFFLWWSMNIHVGVLPLGILAPKFELSFNQSVAASVIGIVLGALCTAYCGTLGPKLGLRAVATSRYSFGFWGAKLCSILNIVIGGGYAVVNLVAVGQVLSAVSDFKMTITVGIIIIAVIGYIISLFGFRIIHIFEKYSWIFTLVLMFVLLGQTAPHVDTSIVPAGDSGLILAGNFLTILSINFSNSSGWCSIASDYYVNYPSKTPAWKVFALTFWGIVIPTTLVTIIGICLGNAALTAEYPPFAEAYADHDFGGLIRVAYHPTGWSKFCLVILTFSVLGNNIANAYSSGLSLQLLGHYFHAVPRFIWSLLWVIVVAVLAIAGQENLSLVVSDFVALLGYWTVSFTFILLIEDQWFRRREGYNLLAWDQPSKLPIGAAAVVALLAGYLAGGVTGMSQVWYIGPIAAKFGGFGGDVGIYLSAAITIVVYPVLRAFERSKTGR